MTATQFHEGDEGFRHLAAFGPSPNPHSSEWRYDRGTAGRLADLCGGRPAFWNLFDTEPEKWSKRRATSSAFDWSYTHDPRIVVLMLGVRVCNAFGVRKPHWLLPYQLPSGRKGVAVPHPSGLNRWWNDPTNYRAAESMLRYLVKNGTYLLQEGLV